MDRVVLTCDQSDFEGTLELARENGVGLEIQTFAYPEALDDDLDSRLARYLDQLGGFHGEITMHGAFMDMASASPDPRVVAVAEERYLQNIRIAETLGAHLLVFHMNFLINIRAEEYRLDWIERQAAFWHRVGRRAADSGLTVALENMWEGDPRLVADVLAAIDMPNVQACLDVGHAHLFSPAPFKQWLTTLGDYVVYCHLNNNSGESDQHRAFDDGVIDYDQVLTELRALPHPPIFSLEISGVEPARRSLRYLDLPGPPGLNGKRRPDEDRA